MKEKGVETLTRRKAVGEVTVSNEKRETVIVHHGGRDFWSHNPEAELKHPP